MNKTKKNLRKAYRAQMRVDLCSAGFWVFTVGLYAFTFGAVALLAFIGGVIEVWFFNSHEDVGRSAFITAFHLANLIETIYLIAVAVLYIWGGPAGVPFLSHKKHGDGEN